MSRDTRNFNHCTLKTVTFTPAWRAHNENRWFVDEDPSAPPFGTVAGFIGGVACPRSGGEQITSDGATTRPRALKLLGKEAAEQVLLCGSCRFADLSPTDYNLQIARERETEATALEAAVQLKAARDAYMAAFEVPAEEHAHPALTESTIALPTLAEPSGEDTQRIIMPDADVPQPTE